MFIYISVFIYQCYICLFLLFRYNLHPKKHKEKVNPMLVSNKESFDWDLNTVNTGKNFNPTMRQENRSKVIHDNLFKSYVFLNKEHKPDPRFVIY